MNTFIQSLFLYAWDFISKYDGFIWGQQPAAYQFGFGLGIVGLDEDTVRRSIAYVEGTWVPRLGAGSMDDVWASMRQYGNITGNHGQRPTGFRQEEDAVPSRHNMEWSPGLGLPGMYGGPLGTEPANILQFGANP